MHEKPRSTGARPRAGETPSTDPLRAAGSGAGGKELLSQVLDGGRLVKLVGLLLAFTLAPLAEIFLFIYIGHLVGNFLVLVLAVLAGAAGALLVADQAARVLAPPSAAPPDVVDLAGVLAAGLFLVTPGFLTDLCGYALLVPRVRKVVGRRLLKAGGPRLRAALERAGSSQSLKIR